jgi:hypothetical protein
MANAIDQRMVNKYARVTARINKLETMRKALREVLVQEFQSGAVCPTSGPWMLVYSEPLRALISWKEEFITLARKYYKEDEEKVARLLVKVDHNARKEPTPTVTVRPNPNFGVGK